MEIKLDLPYGDGSIQKWDLYIPKQVGSSDAKASGVIVFVHGGAWRSGDKAEHQRLAQNLVDATQLPVAVPNYRLSLRNPNKTDATIRHPTHAQDIALALAVIKASPHLESVADTDRLFLVGHSCGAHMISVIMLDPPSGEGRPLDPPIPNDVCSSIKGIILAEGIYDIDLLLESFPSEYYHNFIENAFPDVSSGSFAQYSVNRYTVRAGFSASYLVVHSSNDTLVDVPQAITMYQHLQSEYERLGHSPDLIRKEFSDEPEKAGKQDPWKLGEHDDMLKTTEFARLVASII